MQIKSQTNKKITKSEYFLIPMITDNIELFKDTLGIFCKAEIDIIAGKLPNRIYALFSKDDMNIDRMELIVNFKQFHKIVSIDGNYLLIVFRIPEDYIIDYQFFLQGKYSSFSDKFKKRLLDIRSRKGNEKHFKRIVNVLYPDPLSILTKQKELGVKLELKEVAARPNILEETFTLAKLYNIKL